MCHFYREHANSLGYTIKAQRESLQVFLNQWDAAVYHDKANEPNEIHISGDMNLNSLDDRWLRADYYLISLAKLVAEACNLNNLSQLVKSPTRAQYNSIKGTTDVSCIDHIYCNSPFKCSNVEVISFGNSDHNMISYTRLQKEPPQPAQTIVKRSFKNFSQHDFLKDLSNIDWTPVYMMQDVDDAVAVFSHLYLTVLDVHAPWVKFQKRKNYVPWLSEKTKLLIKERDRLKKNAIKFTNIPQSYQFVVNCLENKGL